jgi:hypothetical protein
VAALAALGAVGAALAPSWQRPRISGAAGFGDLPPLPVPPAAPADPRAPVTTDVTVPVAGTALHATVHAPAGGGRHPAVVLVHGGGAATRAALTDQADRLARSGIVALVYDKRTVGYSFVRRDYDRLADDAVALARVLRGRSDVDPQRNGLWGVSEGGWVVPLAAAREPALSFLILVNAPTMTPGAQLSWAIDDRLRRQHAPAGARRLAARAIAMGGTGYTDHDPLPALRGITQPVLALYGADDRAVPPAQSARILLDTVTTPCTVRFFPGADHGMKVGDRYADGYHDTMVSWIAGLPGTAVSTVAGAVPVQADAASTPPVPPWGRAPVVAAAYGTLVVGAVTALVAARRARRTTPEPGRPVAWRAVRRVAWAALATGVGLNVGVAALVGLGFADAPPIVSQAVWLLLRAGAVGAVLLAVVATADLLRARGSGAPSGGAVAVAGAAAGVATAAALGLAAYWELFAPRW